PLSTPYQSMRGAHPEPSHYMLNRELRLPHLSILHLHPVRPGLRPRGDHAMDLIADEMDRRAVVEGEPGGDLAGAHPLVVPGPALRLAVVVDDAAPGEKSEAWDHAEAPLIGIRESLLEPADASGAHPGEDDASLPGLPQPLRQPPLAPDAQHALGVAA